MFIKSTDLKTDIISQLMKGEGDVHRTHILTAEDFHGIARLYAIHTLKEGASVGYHTHEGEEESYIILEGEALYSDNGNEIKISKGDATLCKSGEGHSIKNIAKDDLIFIGLIYKLSE